MQVEEGKFYRNGEGCVVGPMRRMAAAMAIESDGLMYEYEGVNLANGQEHSYTSDGLFSSMRDGPLRLIKEAPAPDTLIAPEVGTTVTENSFMSEPVTAALTAEPDKSWEAKPTLATITQDMLGIMPNPNPIPGEPYTAMTEEQEKAHAAGEYTTDENLMEDLAAQSPMFKHIPTPGEVVETKDGRTVQIVDTSGQLQDKINKATKEEPVISNISINMRGNTPATREWMLQQIVRAIITGQSMDVKTIDIADEGDSADIILTRR